jgi:hypothetical protein
MMDYGWENQVVVHNQSRRRTVAEQRVETLHERARIIATLSP